MGNNGKDLAQERVEICETLSRNPDFVRINSGWLEHAHSSKYSYQFDWLSRPIIQYPQDIVAVQELIWRVKPDLIVETGIAHGGSLIFSASMLALLDICDAVSTNSLFNPKESRRKVVGIDVDIRAHNKIEILNHPLASRIHMIEGSSIDTKVVDEVCRVAESYDSIMVLLDSNHTFHHVHEELNLYARLTTVGSYCVVFDTIIEELPAEFFGDRPWGPGNNPKTAVKNYLKTHPEFEIDTSVQQKLMITVARDGYLKRVR